MVSLSQIEGVTASTPSSTKTLAGRRAPVRGSRDLAGRLADAGRRLRVHFARPEAFIEAARDVNAWREPEGVARWLVGQAQAWLPVPTWALVADAPDGDEPVVFASAGMSAAQEPVVMAVAAWVVRQGQGLASADLANDTRVVAPVRTSAMAFPLVCRDRTVGALVGLGRTGSRTVPSLGPAASAAFGGLVELAAMAFGNALALQRVEALSVTDDLTLLYNSRYLNGVLRREAKRASRSNRPLAVLFLDLDGFKQVNDNHGHLAGSKALVEAAAVIKGCARETDVVARFGGDEFALVLPETGREGATAVAIRIQERLSATRFLQSDGLSVHLTASIGVAALPDVPPSAEELLRAADMSMYAVKAAGKNGIRVVGGLAPSSAKE